MRRLKLGILALGVVVAVAAMAATSAFAALTEFTVETKAESPRQTVTSTFETPSALEGKLVSSELSSEQAPTSKKLGTLHITFFNTKSENPLLGNATCESLGDAAGVVLVLGEYHVVNAGLILLLISPVHIECLYSTVILLVVQGDLLAKISPVGSSTTSFKLTVKGKKGTQEPAEFENDSAEKVKTKLETSKNEGSAAASSQSESKEVSLETEKATELT